MSEVRYFLAAVTWGILVPYSEYFGQEGETNDVLYKQVDRLPEEQKTYSSYFRVRGYTEEFEIDGFKLASVGISTTKWQDGALDYVLCGHCSHEQYAHFKSAGWLTDEECNPAR